MSFSSTYGCSGGTTLDVVLKWTTLIFVSGVARMLPGEMVNLLQSRDSINFVLTVNVKLHRHGFLRTEHISTCSLLTALITQSLRLCLSSLKTKEELKQQHDSLCTLHSAL